jgi:hypothetical protein
MHNGQLDHGEDWVEAVEVGGESKAVCASAAMAQLTMSRLLK